MDSVARAAGSSPDPSSRQGQRGQSVVEFAVLGSLFFLLVGVIIQGALIFSAWLVITSAAREGARTGAPCYGRVAKPFSLPQTYPVSLSCDQASVQAIVYQAAQGVDATQLQVSVNQLPQQVDPSTGISETFLQVTVNYNVPNVTPFFGQFLPNPIPISAQSIMRLENQPTS